MEDEDVSQQLKVTVPSATTLKRNIIDLLKVIPEKERSVVENCWKQAADIEEKLRGVARRDAERDAP